MKKKKNLCHITYVSKINKKNLFLMKNNNEMTY